MYGSEGKLCFNKIIFVINNPAKCLTLQKILRTCITCGDSFCVNCINKEKKVNKRWKKCKPCLDDDDDDSESEIDDSENENLNTEPKNSYTPAAQTGVIPPKVTPTTEKRKSNSETKDVPNAKNGKNLEKSDKPTQKQRLNIEDWDANAVYEYFRASECSEWANVFKEKQIDGKALLLITRDDVIKYCDLNFGPSIRVYKEIEELINLAKRLTND